MSNNKQSSVEWLIGEIIRHQMTFYGTSSMPLRIIEQAKAMEKKQCVDFALKCMLNGLEPHQSTREVVERLFDEDFNDSDGQK